MTFRIAEHDLYPESIAFDPVSGDFFLGSMGRPRILRIHPDGSYEDFLSGETPGLASSIGMKVDGKRRKLWVCTGRFSLLADYAATASRTGVLQFDIDSGELVRTWMLGQEQESPYHIFNDLALGPNEKYLFVTVDRKIHRLELATGEVVPLVVPDDEDLGTDGLYYCDGSLIAVKPRFKKISRLFLDDDFVKVVRAETLIVELDRFPQPPVPVDAQSIGDYRQLDASSQIRQRRPCDRLLRAGGSGRPVSGLDRRDRAGTGCWR